MVLVAKEVETMKEKKDRAGRIIPERRGENGEVLHLVIHNPAVYNALSVEMQIELVEFLEEAKNDKSIHVIVIRGAGEKSFCAGGEISDLKRLENDDEKQAMYKRGVDIREIISAMDKPIIAAVSGYCIGGGFEVAMCCDMLYASEDSSFSLPEVNLGLVPGWGGAIRLPRKVTVNKAKEMILLGERISAAEAHMWGIVNRVFPKESLFEEVDKIVARLLKQPPLAIRGVKAIVNHGIVDGNVKNAQEIEHRLSIYLMSSGDFMESVDAFKEKRKPVYKGE